MRTAWLLGTLVLLVPAAVDWSRFLNEDGVRRPATPIDAGQPIYATYWLFLSDARRVVADSSSYTIKASDRTAEFELYMLSLGIFRGFDVHPASYFGVQQPGGGQEARYVLVYGSCECPPDTTTMRPVEGGCVCVRHGDG